MVGHCARHLCIAILSFLLAGATMDYLTFQQLHRRGALRRTAISAIIVLIIVSCTSVFTAAQKSAKPPSAETQWPQQMSAYSGLLPELGNLTEKFQRELKYPIPRGQSHLLPLLPESTVFYAAFPNYGDVAHQALEIIRQERKTRPALRDWWQQGGPTGPGPMAEDAIEKFYELSQYVGDEIVVAGAMNGKEAPSIAIVAEVKKPGLKIALRLAVMELAIKNKDFANSKQPGMRVLDQQELAAATDGPAHELIVLVRPDVVIGAFDLATLRNFNARLDSKREEFLSTPFGQRIEQAYQGGASILGALDLQKMLGQAPIPAAQRQTFQRTGFAEMKYLVWEHKGVETAPAGQAELSFTGPRHGIASWLGAPRDLDSLDFVSPKTLFALTLVLKNPSQVFDDIQELASASNPKALATMDQMQQGLGFNLKNDLFKYLGGEITLNVDNPTGPAPEWKAILQVSDPGHLQATLTRLLATAGMREQRSSDGELTYHSLPVPNPNKPMEVSYTFVDGYWVIGSSQKTVREAVRMHRAGESLAKSQSFLAALPPGHSSQASALFYEDPMAMAAMSMAKFSPEMAAAFSQGSKPTKPALICAYGEESAIREASTSSGVDAGAVAIVAAVAIPNLLRARSAANESSAVGSLRMLVTAQTMYSASYPARGFARDLAMLGPFPGQAGVASANHASLIDSKLGNATCTAGAWCEKSGYRFAFAPVCKIAPCKEFVAVATPVSSSTGSRNFCATSDGVIRFSVGPPLTSTLSAAKCNSWAPLR